MPALAHNRRFVAALAVSAVVVALAALTFAIASDLSLVRTLHEAHGEHIDQNALLTMVQKGDRDAAFELAFEHGDELFETEFNAVDGSGANVGDGSRFTRVPRADLTGAGQWANHTPARATGPNALSCNACHIQLFDDGAGSAVGNVHRDPLHSGNLKQFIQRNTPHLFAPGALQRLAEEMTVDLHRTREATAAQACAFGSATSALNAKGVSFGSIRAVRTRANPCAVSYDASKVAGVSSDLVVRPFQWKGNFTTLREFNRDAANGEIGMQPVEFTGDGVDGDFDGVRDELTIGDITALTVYLAAQPRPTTSMELASLGLIDPLPAEEAQRITRGSAVFNGVGCDACHARRLLIDNPVFSEPSRVRAYRDERFPAGQDPVSRGVDPRFPVSFDLTRDQPDNIIMDGDQVVFRLGSLVKDQRGRAVVELFSDLKRHNMGTRLAEAIDEAGTGAATFLTRPLWGLGSTGPYLHDGRATTIAEAILEHGGDAAASRNAFLRTPYSDQQALVAFLANLVLFKMEEEEVVVPPPPTTQLNSALRIRRAGR
jgi:hypothetical protein